MATVDDEVPEWPSYVEASVTAVAGDRYRAALFSRHKEPVWDNDRSAVTIVAATTTPPPTEGDSAVFVLHRTLRHAEELAVAVTVSENGSMLSGPVPTEVTFAAGSATATLSVATVDDEEVERDGIVTATVPRSQRVEYRAAQPSRASITVLDNDLPP